MEARLFISHSGADIVLALAFRTWLVENGWQRDDVFLDFDCIKAGRNWRETLAKAIESCEAFVFLASPEALASDECRKELELADRLSKNFVIVLLPGVEKSDPRLDPYRHNQFANLAGTPQDAAMDVEHEGATHHVTFNSAALQSIKARLTELGIAPDSFAWLPKDGDASSPYLGLAPFKEDDAGIFFGRSAEIRRALDEFRTMGRIPSRRILVIHAPSGAGKSSFLQAGLWPRLLRDPGFAPLAILRPARGILTGPDGLVRRLSQWFERHRRNFDHGNKEEERERMSAALGADGADGDLALARMIAEATEIAAGARRAFSPGAARPAPILAIDQGEELFHAENDAESRRLLSQLGALLRDPPDDVDLFLIIAIRTDSLDILMKRLSQELQLEPATTLHLDWLSRANYRDVISLPVVEYSRRVRPLKIDEDLVHALATEAAEEREALPLLAFTLERMFADFSAKSRVTLTLDDYQAIGRISGSIERALNEAVASAGSEGGKDEDLRRLILPRLATWDPGADGGKGAAKRLVALEKDVFGGDRAGLRGLADKLVEAHLLRSRRGALEVTHEALLRLPPISGWLDEDREFLVWRDRIGRIRAEYVERKRGLLMGLEFRIARDWLEKRPEEVPDDDRQFIETSAAERQRRKARADERKRRHQEAELNLALTQVDAAEAREQAAQRLARLTRAGLAVLAFVSLVALGAGAYGAREAYNAVAAQNDSLTLQSKFLANLSKQEEEGGDYATIMLLATEALPDKSGHDRTTSARPYIGQAEVILENAYRELRELAIIGGHGAPVTSMASTPDGRHIVTGSADRTVRLWDARTGKERRLYSGHRGKVNSVAVTPDSAFIISGSNDKTARIWSLAEPDRPATVLSGHKSPVSHVAVTPDGSIIVTASEDGEARLWDAATGRLRRILAGRRTGHLHAISSLAISGDGSRILTGSLDGSARVWDSRTGEERAVLKLQFGPLTGDATAADGIVAGLAATPDGSRIITVMQLGLGEHLARLWRREDASDRRYTRLGRLDGRDYGIASVAITADGERIFAGSSDGAIRCWNTYWDKAPCRASTDRDAPWAKGHRGAVTSLLVTSDGSRLISTSTDGTARVWDARGGGLVAVLNGHQKSVLKAVATPDGARIATLSDDGAVRLWETEPAARKPRTVETFPADGEPKDLNSLAQSADGSRIAVGAVGGSLCLWDPRGPATEAGETTFKGPGKSRCAVAQGRYRVNGSYMESIALTPDGKGIIADSWNGVAHLLDSRNLQELARFTGHEYPVGRVAVTPDGSRVITGSDDAMAMIWNARTGERLAVLKGHQGRITAVAASPDGSRIFTGSADKTARVWEAGSGKLLAELKGHRGAVTSVSGTPDNASVVTGSEDGTARIWEVRTRIWGDRTGKAMAELSGHQGKITSVAATPDGGRIITGSTDKTTRVWDARTGGELAVLRGPLGEVKTAAVTADGRNILILARDPVTGRNILSRWPLSPAGQDLVERSKILTPRCLTPDQRKLNQLPPNPPAWCGDQGKWPYGPSFSIAEGRRLVSMGADSEAEIVFAEARRLIPSADGTIRKARVAGLLELGRGLVRQRRYDEANAAFERAARQDPSVIKQIDRIWADALRPAIYTYIARGNEGFASLLVAEAIKSRPHTERIVKELAADALLTAAKTLLDRSKYQCDLKAAQDEYQSVLDSNMPDTGGDSRKGALLEDAWDFLWSFGHTEPGNPNFFKKVWAAALTERRREFFREGEIRHAIGLLSRIEELR